MSKDNAQPIETLLDVVVERARDGRRDREIDERRQSLKVLRIAADEKLVEKLALAW